jgi:aspartate/methionine/tyrosine aminotransferase
MDLFNNNAVNIDVLKQRAFNYRWAEVPDGVIPLTAADPDFGVAQEIREAIIHYTEAGYFCYTPKLGMPEFIEAIQRYLYETKGEEVEKECILPIDSAARGMYIIAEALLTAGDDAIVFNPVDFLFKKSVEHAGANPVLFPANVVNGKIDLSDLETYITGKTKMICLCNPHNPLGLLYEKDDLQLILDLAEKYDLWIMNDEIWSDIIYPEKPFLSILNVDQTKNYRVFSVYGFSKSFGIAGLRAGCIYCNNKKIFEKIIEASCVRETAGGIGSLSQIAGIACLNDSRYWLDAFKKHLTEMRDYLCERVNLMPGISCRRPEATYLAYVDIRSFEMNSEAFVNYICKSSNVQLIPGGEKFFGSNSEGYIRICFATSKEILKEGLDRLEQGIQLLLSDKQNSGKIEGYRRKFP